MSADYGALALCPTRQRAAASLPNDGCIEKVRRARGGIGYVTGKDAIGNPCCLPIARMFWGDFFNFIAPCHPWLKLPRLRDDLLDLVTPSAALLAIENDMGNGGFADSRLMRSLKGNRPDHVISILKIVAA